jgi:hypothetical protein
MMYVVINNRIEHVTDVCGIAHIRRGLARPAWFYEIHAHLANQQQRLQTALERIDLIV